MSAFEDWWEDNNRWEGNKKYYDSYLKDEYEQAFEAGRGLRTASGLLFLEEL